MFFIKFQAKHILYIVIYIAICLKLKEMFNKLRHVFSFEFWAKYIYCDLYIFNKPWCKITLDGSWSNLPLLLVKSHLLSGLEVFVFFCPVYLIMASFTTVYFLLPCLLWPCSTLTAVCFCVLPSSLLLAPPPTRWLRPVLEPTAAPITAAAAAQPAGSSSVKQTSTFVVYYQPLPTMTWSNSASREYLLILTKY